MVEGIKILTLQGTGCLPTSSQQNDIKENWSEARNAVPQKHLPSPKALLIMIFLTPREN